MPSWPQPCRRPEMAMTWVLLHEVHAQTKLLLTLFCSTTPTPPHSKPSHNYPQMDACMTTSAWNQTGPG